MKRIEYKIVLNKYIEGIDKDKYSWYLRSDAELKEKDIIFLHPNNLLDDMIKTIPLKILKICPEFSGGYFLGYYICLVSKAGAEDAIKDMGYGELYK